MTSVLLKNIFTVTKHQMLERKEKQLPKETGYFCSIHFIVLRVV